jgi:excisionase family DNA binding protein
MTATTTTRDDTLLTPADAARLLCVSREMVYKMFQRGTLAGVKLGPQCVRIYRDSVQAILDAGRKRVQA